MAERFRGDERRKLLQGNRFGIDKSLNVANIVAAMALLGTMWTFGSKIVTYLQAVDNKVTVMWQQFIEDHPEKAEQYRYMFRNQ
jgi:hypothetical protein